MAVSLLRGDVPKVRFYRLMIIASEMYLLGTFMQYFASNFESAYFSVIISYLGAPFIAPPLMLFVLDLHNRPIKRRYALLYAYPIVVCTLVATWPINGIFYKTANFEAGSPFSYIYVEPSIFHTLSYIYMFSLMVIALIMVIRYIVREGRAARRREGLVLAAMTSPFICMILYFTGVLEYDITPIGITITNLIIYYSVFRFNQLDLIPLAKDRMLEYMGDAYLVVDDEWRFFDANRQAKSLFPVLHAVMYGANLLSLSEEIAALKKALDEETELLMERDGVSHSYRPSRTLVKVSATKMCYCILLYENTATWRRMSDLQQKASYDSLTGVLNRGAFIPKVETVLKNARANSLPLAMLVFDIDFFKVVNDTHGHLGGDAVLREIAQCIDGRLRPGDVFGRIGGEEFSACLLKVSEADALSVANNLRKIVKSTPFVYKDELLDITVSIGICFFDGKSDVTLNALLDGADKALYAAKAAGRDCVRLLVAAKEE